MIAARHGAVEVVAGQGREDGEGDPGADALDRGQQPEPVALVARGEADQPDVVLGDLHDGVEHDLAADRPERGEGAGRGEDQIADAVHVDDGMVGGEAVEQAAELGDHAGRCGVVSHRGRSYRFEPRLVTPAFPGEGRGHQAPVSTS